MKLPFKVTKDEYLNFVNNTNFNDDDLQNMLDQSVIFILNYCQFISSRNWIKRFEHKVITEHQLEVFKDAVIYQVAYCESNGGDVLWTNGYSESSNSFVSSNALFEKYLAPMAKMRLSSAGILYGGILC